MNARNIVLLASILASFSGCATTVPKDPMVSLPVSDLTIVQGSRYELEVKTDDRSRVHYIGEILDVNDEFVVFDGAIKRAEVEYSPPLPLLARYFSNKGIGMEEIEDNVRIRRDDIIDVKPLDLGPERLTLTDQEDGSTI